MAIIDHEINRFKSMESLQIMKQAANMLGQINEFNYFYQNEKQLIYKIADNLREIAWDVENSGLVIKK